MKQEWMEVLKDEPLSWLLEPDAQNPGVRYFALLELLDRPEDDPEILEARRAVMSTGPVPTILEAQHPDGYWVEPGPGYRPKYRSTVWSVIMLAQLGADGSDPRVRLAGDYILDHAIASTGSFSMTGAPSMALHCLSGNLSAALLDLGWLGDERLHGALEWLAKAITGQGIAPAEQSDAPLRFYRSGACAPGFCCSANNRKPCAWGAIKTMLAFAKLPDSARTPLIQSAIDAGIGFLSGRDPAIADYPTAQDTKPSQSWFRFGFPLFYVTDVLQNLEVLTRLGYATDPRLAAAVQLLLGKQQEHGRWKMEYTYNGKTWVDIEEKSKPSKWVTLRALRVLKARR
jgi:hypothetical protein